MKDIYETSVLKKREVYSYGMGEFGYTFFYSMVSSYLMYFMTDIVLMPVAPAGILYSVLQCVEAVTAIAAGILIDRVCLKSGRYRPWMLWGSILCGVGLVAFFTNYHLGIVGSMAVFAVFYTLSYIGYNIMFVGYRALTGLIGKNSRQTVQLTIAGTQLSTVSSLLFGWFGVKLLNGFSSPDTGYAVSAAIYGAIMIVSMYVVYRMSKPYDIYSVDGNSREDEKLSPQDMMAALIPLIPYGIAYIISIGSSTVLFTMVVYYFNDVAQDPTLMSTLYTVMTVTRLAGTFIVNPLAARMDKKDIFIGTCVLSGLCILLAYWFRENTFLFFLFMGGFFFIQVPGGAMFIPCVTDITDYNEHIRGIKARSFLYSVASTLSYLAQLIGAAASAIGLVIIQYSAGCEMTPEMAGGIAILTFVLTAGMKVISVVPMIFYRLDRKTMEQVHVIKRAKETEEGTV